jgi:restriction endonuclease Mrr
MVNKLPVYLFNECVYEGTNNISYRVLRAENYRHKYDLVEAEKARVMNSGKAEDYYDRAIAAARESGYIQIEALANELAAEFYLLTFRRSSNFLQIY